jgi:hypothetical protein
MLKKTHALFLSLISTTASTSAGQPKSQGKGLLGTLIFYNIVVLEAMKTALNQSGQSSSSSVRTSTAAGVTSDSSADCEHMASLSFQFLNLTLDFFSHNFLQLREKRGASSSSSSSSSRVLDFLRGPYLAQLIQSCLQLSQHR